MPRIAQRAEQRAPQRVKLYNAMNRYEVDQSRIPPGMSYEWKRKTVFGQDDVEHLINLDANGWVPVPCERHPELTGKYVTGKEIVRGGLVLMERSQEITDEARNLDMGAADDQVTHQVRRLGQEGKIAAGKKGIKRGYEPITDDE